MLVEVLSLSIKIRDNYKQTENISTNIKTIKYLGLAA